KPGEPAKEPKEKKPAKKVIIEHLLIKDGKVLAKVIGLPTAPIPLTTIEKFDIGKDDGGTSYGQASVEIISAIYDSIANAVTGLAGGATDLIKGAGDMSTDEAVEAGSKALKSIGGMFKKKE
ncbi:MAG: hypothetical protein K9M45_06730, partial [Kiritimatiellales bacterium]|nr:hypothetical protein [Kiritimatiellales bacterium]